MYNFIVDSHCHLDLIEQKGINITEILSNCHQANVKILQTICTSSKNFQQIYNYCKIDKNIYCSFGIHPCNVQNEELITAQKIIDYCKHNPKIIGIGETGLDYYHDLSFVELQKQSFIEHIMASQQTALPLIIHSRNADQEMAKILVEYQKKQNFPAILHCFSSSMQLAETAIDLGIYISIAGIVTFKNAIELQEIVKKIPLEFLLLETDSPYLAPSPFRGKVNQPSFTLEVAKFIAELKNIELAKVIDQTTKNFLKIFSKVEII